MDLNSSPAPEEDDEEVFNGHYDEGNVAEERNESAVEVFRREREERRKKLKRAHPNDGPPRRDVNLFRNEGYARSHRPQNRDRLPPGWLDCPSFGQSIHCLIPSKVPLGEAYDDAVPPGKRYSFRQVMRVMGKDLGMVIDLTNTTRYYQASDLKRSGIKYIKISCRGRGAAPDNASVNTFVHEVSQFLSRPNRLKKCILVHCTHGHNRTGFMIVHYLMRSQPINVSEAIHMFADSRPPGIYKQDYIAELFNFYHEKRPETVICPPTPEWKRSSDLDLNGEAVQDDDDDGNGEDPPVEAQIDQILMTNDDVLGDDISADQEEELQQKCCQLLKLPLKRHKSGDIVFPGSHPVSLSRKNLQLLRQRYYYATWKADGTRYMMLITHDGCYLIDRKFKFRRVQLRFPAKHSNEGGTHNLTLLDGEMVIDTLPGTKTQARRYLIYDLMVIGGLSVTERPFYERWKLLEKEVIEPRLYERKNINLCRNPYYRYEMEPFSVRRKDFWLLSTVTKLLKEFIPMLSHDADGLIFQGWDDSYVTHTHEGLLKWKYPEMNSVDFLYEVEDGREKLFVFDRGQKKLMDGSKVLFKEEEDNTVFSGKIIECSYDMEEGAWIFMRVRVDKSTPNEFRTYHKVFESIVDNITEDDLLKEIKEIVSLPMYADRIRNDSKPQIHHQQQGSRRR